MIDDYEYERHWEDPIVAELHKIRKAMFEEAGGDLTRLAERLRRDQAESGAEVVTLPPRRPAPTSGEAA